MSDANATGWLITSTTLASADWATMAAVVGPMSLARDFFCSARVCDWPEANGPNRRRNIWCWG